MLIQRDPSTQLNTSYVACVAGNSCLEVDLVSWRKLQFDRRPTIGDLLVYCNTAGYQMDSNESEFHQIPLPEKLSVLQQLTDVQWMRETEFSLLHLMPN